MRRFGFTKLNFNSSFKAITQNKNRDIHASFLSTSSVSGANIKKGNDSALDLTFSDHETAYRSKTTWEVFRGYLVFRLCAMTYIVDHNQRLMNVSRKLLGKTLFEKLMKSTVYGHFVAGEDENEIIQKMRRLEEFGVHSILDYSAEEDVSAEEIKNSENLSKQPPPDYSMVTSPMKEDQTLLRQYKIEEKFSDRREKAKCRTYFYKNEEQCDKNAITFLKSILIVGSEQLKAKEAEDSTARFAAIKLTALGRPELLIPLSEAISRVHQYMSSFSGKFGVGSVLEHQMTPKDLEKELEKAAKTNPEVNDWLNRLVSDDSGLIHIMPWDLVIQAKTQLNRAIKVPNIKTGNMDNLARPLSENEEKMFKNMMKRLHTIFILATKLNVRVMVDAEQSYFQLAISRITMEMMKIYNKDKPIVFNTYQCYMKTAQHNLLLDLIQAERQQFHFGAKLVRGAYMEQERARALGMGYEDPINADFATTTEMYKTCMTECLRRMKSQKEQGSSRTTTIMAATHNEETIKYTIEKMQEFGISKQDQRIYFGQLYGMCDQISFPLGQAGYSVYKYVPYGPVAEVLPYLSRRLQENRGLIEKTVKERKLLRKELFRRMTTRK